MSNSSTPPQDSPAAPHVMTVDEIHALMRKEFPQAEALVCLERVSEGKAWVTLNDVESNLRPGGTVSGPAMMTLADTAAYYLILSLVGPVALAVTTSLHIDFLRRPKPTPMTACARLLKLGKRLAVCSVEIETGGELVANATLTYSIPPAQRS